MKKNQSYFEHSNIKVFLIIVLLCFVVYGNSIFNDFSLDEPNIDTKNEFVIRGVGGIPGIIEHPYQFLDGKKLELRPLSEITLALEYQLIGFNPYADHFINIVLYAVLSWLLYRLLLRFKLTDTSPYLPVLITCFFIVHPAHTAVVDSVKNREELMALLFGLVSLLFAFNFYTRRERKVFNFLAVLLSFLLSLLSKATCWPLLGVIMLMMYQFGPVLQTRKSFILLLIAFIVSGLLSVLGVPLAISVIAIPLALVLIYHESKDVRMNVVLVYALYICALVYFKIYDNFGRLQPDFGEGPITVNHPLAFSLDTLWFYFKFMFFPFPNRYYYGFGSISLHRLTDGVLIFSFLVHAAILIYGCYALWNRSLLGFIILCYFICIFPYSNVLTRYNGIVSEGALFLPSIWFTTACFMALFSFLGKIERRKFGLHFRRVTWVAIGGLFLLYAVMTIQRNMQWKNMLSLASADMPKLENSVVPNMIDAEFLKKAGETQKNDTTKKQYFDKAIKRFQHITTLWPDNAEAYFKLGMLYRYNEGKVDSACSCFDRAYSLDSLLLSTAYQTALCKFEKGNYTESVRIFETLHNRTPKDTFILNYYAKSLFAAGDSNGARHVVEELNILRR